jgi:hypothetical protein
VVAVGLGDLAAVVVALGQPLRGARLGGVAEALREALGVPLAPAARSNQDQAVQAMRAALGEEAFAAAWAEGRAMPLEEAVALALEAQGGGAEAPIRAGSPGCEADVVDRQRVQ